MIRPSFLMKKHIWSIVLSVLMVVAGLAAIIIPPVAGLAATLVIGWLLIFSGVAHLIYCWHRRGAGGVIWEILVGIVYLIVGFCVVRNPVGGLASLTLALAIYLLAKAVLEVILALTVRGKMGAWLWFDVVVNVILAVMIWGTWPVSSAWAIGTLIGIGILFTGTTRLLLAIEGSRERDSHP